MQVKQLLEQAKALIDTPEKWTKGALARDAGGQPVAYFAPDARCFCTAGALQKACNNDESNSRLIQAGRRAIYKAMAERDKLDVSIERFNDHTFTTHAEVMAVFDLAIEAQDENS